MPSSLRAAVSVVNAATTVQTRKRLLMRDVAVIGIGMTRFGRFPDRTIGDLVKEAVEEALIDASIDRRDIEAAYVGNAAAGAITGQHMIRGQVALAPLGIDAIPVYNVENACASSSFAFNLAWTAVAADMVDCALVVGVEKLFNTDKHRSYLALESGIDIDNYRRYFENVERQLGGSERILMEGGPQRSRLLDVYAFHARRLMSRYGLTREHFARIAVKAHRNGALNPRAHFQDPVTAAQVLASGEISAPLTRMMCAPVSDGAAAAILCSQRMVNRLGGKPVWVAASVVGSGKIGTDLDDTATRRAAARLYESSGIAPEDIDVAEVHDTTSPAEIMYLLELGLCQGADICGLVEQGHFDLGGGLPTNPSGGLSTKGHPVGATGVGQIHEVVMQLRGAAGRRQVRDPVTGLTHNGGGILGIDAAAMALHVFKR